MLNDLFIKYGTDKQTSKIGWGYTEAYEEHLEQNREGVTSVLEIGICGHRDIPHNVVGASLFAWRDYFPNSVIYGIDNDARFVFNDQDRIKTELADAYNSHSLGHALRKWDYPTFDFICDDCVHDPIPQLWLFRTLYPFLKAGGKYAIEESCPYKFPGNRLEMIGDMMHSMFADMQITEYSTGKEERLLMITKPDR